MRILIEEHFYWTLALDRWVYNEGKGCVKFFGKLPESVPTFLWPIIFKLIGKYLVSKQAYNAGIGRHTREEVEKMAEQDLKAVSDLLGDKQFMFGDEPSLLDCTLFGFTCMILYASLDDCPHKKTLEGSCKNLTAHNKRMIEKYWSDWDKVIART